MKKFGWVLLTLALEAIVLWVVSVVLTWNFMDILFLGSLGIFAIVWLLLMWTNQSNNSFNVSEKAWTGQDAGGVKQFHVHFSPVMIGMVLFVVGSFVMTIIYYAEYL
ncbi:hypothetical protein VBD025_18115 [Virgibacillus flavescens]|uniref:hypothetical protein n=1 Tax=Virgibacillus flavescens TaxID=1611422 RepID=UPI003D335DFF